MAIAPSLRLAFLDVYRKSGARISKDTAGGYGTENDLGESFISKLASLALKHIVHWPSLSFIQLMTQARSRGFHVEYKKYSAPAAFQKLSEYDVFFVCASIVCFETEVQALRTLKVLYPNKKIFFCGTVAEHLKSEVPDGVSILSGNYDFFFENIASDTDLRSMTENRLTVVEKGNPNGLIQINWHDDPNIRPKNRVLSRSQKFIPFLSSRGCPYSCREYCTYPASQGTKVVSDDIKVVIDKLQIIDCNTPNAQVVFRDPVFSINLKRSKELLRRIIEADLSLNFTAELHLRNIDEEFIKLCKEARLSTLKFGIESADENVRDNVNRISVSNDEQRQIIKDLKRNGIRTVGMFILAQPIDTWDSCVRTIDYALSLNLDIAQFSIFTPYPGTPAFKKFRILEDRYEKFGQFDLVYEHPILTKADARKLLDLAYQRFFWSKATALIRKPW